MASQLIGTTETGWFNPGVNPPPFDMKLLLMVAGVRSEDCGRTFESYSVVMTAYVQQQGPGDEYDDEPACDEYMSGDKTDFLDFQFDLKDEDGEVLDWYSDSIVAWAYYPLGIAQTAVNVERERQAALVPNKKGNDMSVLWLTVEVSPGASISNACDEAVALAWKTGLTIWFDFNGVKCLARAGDDPRRIEVDWNRVMASNGRGIQIAADNDKAPNA